MSKSKILCLVLALLFLVAVGCGPSDPDPVDPVDPDPVDDPPDDGPRQGGTLTIGYHREPSNLHPGQTTGLPDIMLNILVYDSLVMHDENMDLHPSLATSWDVSEDGLTWVFHLRDDVVFHSGNPLTAHDVKAHFDRWKEAPTAVKIGSLDSTEVLDDHTVQFNLAYPTLVFLNMISQTEWGYGGIPENAMVEQYGEDYGIVPESISGTGPFKVAEWVRGYRVVLDRNEDYVWGTEAYENQGPAHLDRVIIRTIPESATRTAALDTGDIDMDISVSPHDAGMLEGMPGLNLFTMPKLSANQLGFNMTHPIASEDEVRFAFAHAINQQEIVDMAWNGYAEPTVGFWHPSVEGSTPEAEIRPYHRQFDPDKASQILDEAGWVAGSDGGRTKDGTPLELDLYVYTGVQEDVAVVIQEQLRNIGAEINIRAMELPAVQEAVRANQHHMRYVDGTHSTADFAYWFVTDSIPLPNYLYWSDEKFDSLFEITQTTVDNSERVQAFQDIEKRILETQVMIPMPHHMWLVGHRDGVHLGTFHPIHGIYRLMDTWLEDN